MARKHGGEGTKFGTRIYWASGWRRKCAALFSQGYRGHRVAIGPPADSVRADARFLAGPARDSRCAAVRVAGIKEFTCTAEPDTGSPGNDSGGEEHLSAAAHLNEGADEDQAD